ncbi:hypothetical protein [Saccharopolyspora sp.]|uniref:hypothetical protein n=1 Tax=Saccharopolyspora sp. TaxID=33915 RepID=UPI0025D4247A|nr:hypothetical protein [Saccharopolyspora sp.]
MQQQVHRDLHGDIAEQLQPFALRISRDAAVLAVLGAPQHLGLAVFAVADQLNRNSGPCVRLRLDAQVVLPVRGGDLDAEVEDLGRLLRTGQALIPEVLVD